MTTEALSISALLAIARAALPRGNAYGDVSAEDVVQEAFLRLHRERARLAATGEEIRNQGAWMRTVIRSVAIDLSRQKWRRAQVPIEQTSSEDGAPFTIEPMANEVAQDERIVRDERDKMLDRAIAMLPPAQRKVMELEREGYNTKEIAAALNVDNGAVRTARCRAYNALRHLLSGNESQG